MEFLKDYMKSKREKKPEAKITYAELKILRKQFSDSCLSAVQKNGLALKDVPEKFKTDEICLAAIQSDARAVQYVPAEGP
jgi:hypothetical protein